MLIKSGIHFQCYLLHNLQNVCAYGQPKCVPFSICRPCDDIKKPDIVPFCKFDYAQQLRLMLTESRSGYTYFKRCT